MVEHVLDNLAPISDIDRVYVVTNAKFADHFQTWSENYRATKSKLNFTVVNDHSTDDTNKLGAIGDINYVLKTQNVDDDLIIVAGDNLFSEKLGEFGKFCREKNAPVLALYDVGNLEEIKKYNAISTDANGKITFFEEKPKNPDEHAHRHRALFLSARDDCAHQAIHRRGQQSRPARPPCAMALPAHGSLYLARARPLVRHRLEGNAGRSEYNFREILELRKPFRPVTSCATNEPWHMDFFNQEAHAQKQTRRLIWLFGLAVLAFVVFAYLIFAVPFLILFEPLKIGSGGFLKWIWDARVAFWVAITTLIPVSLGCLYKFRLLSGGGSTVAELLGGRKIDDNPSDSKEKQLHDVVEEMAVASQMSVPEIYVLDRERGINAFAAGHTREDVAIGVTFGAMKLLTRDELQGIVAHEFSHVLNGDTRLNMKLMALAHGLSWPTILGRILVRGSTQAPEIGASIFDEDAKPTFLPTAPIGALFLIIGGISTPFVRLLKSLICREREWLADSSAVQFTRNPAGISGALKKIGGLLQGRAA